MPSSQPLARRVLALALGVATTACGARAATPLHCADGALPCADQIVAVHCETLSDGMAPPDVGEVRWMFDGAKLPQRGVPPLSITSWCSGVLEVTKEASKSPLPIELYQGVEGGYLQVPGRDRVWFEAPPEESDTKRARMCVDEPLPVTLLQSMTCKPIAGGTLLDDAAVHAKLVGARRVTLDELGWSEGTRFTAWCEASIDPSAPLTKPSPGKPAVTLQNGLDPAKKVRIDLFEGAKGWIRLPGERRLCFAAPSAIAPS